MSLDEIREHPHLCLAVVLTAWQGQINLINQRVPYANTMPSEMAIDIAIETLIEENHQDIQDLLESFSELNDYIRNQVYTLPF